MFSILYSEPFSLRSEEPGCFRDLNLDSFLGPILRSEKRISLAPWFYTPVPAVAQAEYRQQIQKDLLKQDNLRALDTFSREICSLADREDRAAVDLDSGDPWRCHYLLYGHILDQGEQYVSCVTALCSKLPDMDLQSRGLAQAAELLKELEGSSFFRELSGAQASLRKAFQGLRYVIQIRNGTLRVKKYEGEQDLSGQISSVFAKFQEDRGRDYRQKLPEEPYADHVEAALLQCLSRVYPREFEELSAYVKRYSRFLDKELLNFCRELRFYIDWLQVIKPLQNQGLPFCFPVFQDSQSSGRDLFDLTLAGRIGREVVKNDFTLDPGEQILVVTGPNQGGKTTFARTLGQLHYLASLGLCVPGSSAAVRLADRVLTHFGREKAELQGSGRLQDDLQRLHHILEQATDHSFLVINEIFASTSARDGTEMGKKMLEAIRERGSRTVLVTFLGELAEGGPDIVSMMSTVDPEHPELRTYRILRRAPDAVTYAMTLAKKHGLTYDQVVGRIKA